MIPAIPTAIAILAAIAGFTAGYAFEHRARQAEVAEIRADIARREAEAAEAARRRIEAASQAADAALKDRDARLAALDAANRRLRHDLSTATTGRPCLSHDARRLLQQSPAFGLKLPQAAGGLAPAPAGSSADPGESAESTDADLAHWILDAAALYEQCRARIDALRAWSEMTHGR